MSNAAEHLRVAHHLALRAQHHSEPDAAALLRAWPNLAHAALEAHGRLTAPQLDPDRVVQRVALDAEAFRRSGSHRMWPGPGRPDAMLEQVSSALSTAADMAAGLDSPDDGAEADHLIASTIWTSAQIVSRSLSDFGFDIRHNHRTPNLHRDEISMLATVAHRRVNAVEQMAAAYVTGIHSPAGTRDVGLRLHQAVATWDIESHRALLGDQSTAVLHVLAHLQAESVKAVERFISRAPAGGLIDEVSAGRLSPVLRDSSSSWEQLRDSLEDLSFASTTVPLRFIDSARDLQDAFAAAAHTAHGADGRSVVQALSSHLESSVTISASACDLIDTGELRAPARAVARLLNERFPGEASPQIAPVSATAILRRQTIPLDEETRRILHQPAQRVLANAHEAVRRAAGLDALYRAAPAPASPRTPRDASRRAPTPTRTPGVNSPAY